ncbi:amidase domain-containing protein [Paenibacillus marinisediminis]
MRQAWKNTLYLYVDQHNRNEVDDRRQPLQVPIMDMGYTMRMSERAQRMKEWYSARDTYPVRSETKAKLVRTHESEGEAVVDLEFHVQLMLEQQGLQMMEERIESERITLGKEGDGWVITQIEQPQAERHARGIYREEKEEKAHISRSTPYLNTDILGGQKPASRIPYRRNKAVEYAEQWWNESNPRFLAFEVDCTNYVSQCLFAGGAPMNYTGKREMGWWFKGMVNGREAWSFSWAVSNGLNRYLDNSTSGLRAERVDEPKELQLGDIIQYDWDGNGNFQHSTIVTAFDMKGMPLVNAHTNNSRHRYWDYQDSYAWTEATTYRFFHITDAF